MSRQPPQDESGWTILGEAMLFLGMLTSVGGLLVILVRGLREPIWALLTLIGVGVWITGYLLKHRRPDNASPDHDGSDGDSPRS